MIMDVVGARASRIGAIVPGISGFVDTNFVCLVQKILVLENNPQAP